MQRLEVSCAVRLIYTSLGAKGLTLVSERLKQHMQQGGLSRISVTHRYGCRTLSTFLRPSVGGLRPSTACRLVYISWVLGLKSRHNHFFLDRRYVVFQNIFI